jgi:hypothetical protein
LYSTGGLLLLVSNRHVFIDEKEGHRPDRIVLRIHTNVGDLRQNAEKAVRLYEGGTPRWHDRGTEGADIAVLPVGLSDVAGAVAQPFSASDLVTKAIIEVGEDLIVIGYPHGLHDNVHNLPILRRATLASAYPVPFKGEPYFLIDARLHEGMSGSPVITKPSPVRRYEDTGVTLTMGRGEPKWNLLGIVSAAADKQSASGGLDLHVVWFAELIENLAAQQVEARTPSPPLPAAGAPPAAIPRLVHARG